MSANTKIEWADHTFNPWVGCTKVSPACDHCYAEGWAKRSGHVKWGSGQPRRRTSDANWRMPIKWDREAERTGVRPRVFCASLADVFDNEVDPAWRRDLFRLIADTPNLDWILLTKRIGNVRSMVPLEWLASSLHGAHGKVLYPMGWPENVWLGATVVNQEEADRDIPKLLDVPAAKRFLSIEPMLGPIDLSKIPHSEGYGCSPCSGCGSDVKRDALSGRTFCKSDCDGPILESIDWVIVGGESGPKARPMHPDWVRSLRDQCVTTGTPFMFKQWGEWAPFSTHENYCPLGVAPDGSSVGPDDEFTDDCALMYPVGKEAAGRMLDGREWDEVPA